MCVPQACEKYCTSTPPDAALPLCRLPYAYARPLPWLPHRDLTQVDNVTHLAVSEIKALGIKCARMSRLRMRTAAPPRGHTQHHGNYVLITDYTTPTHLIKL